MANCFIPNPGELSAARVRCTIFGQLQRNGEMAIQMLANVQQKTIEPLIKKIVQTGGQVYTDKYNIYHRLSAWGYAHKTVNHFQGE